MIPLMFLAMAVGLSVVGSLVVLAWSRWPRRSDDAISTFAREMRALAPDDPSDRTRVPPRSDGGFGRPPGDSSFGGGAPAPWSSPSVRPAAPPEE